ncbi:hypothetical protein RCL1_001769 [Eukaryota sp. TZLM3-RCL]
MSELYPTEALPSPPVYEAPSKRKNVVLAGVAAGVLLIVLGLVVAFVLSGSSDDNDDSDTNPDDPYVPVYPLQYRRFNMSRTYYDGDVEVVVTVTADLDSGRAWYITSRYEAGEVSSTGTYTTDDMKWNIHALCLPAYRHFEDFSAYGIDLEARASVPIDQMYYSGGLCDLYKMDHYWLCMDKGWTRLLCVDDKGLVCDEFTEHSVLEEDQIIDVTTYCEDYQEPYFIQDEYNKNGVHIDLLEENLYYEDSGQHILLLGQLHSNPRTPWIYEYNSHSCSNRQSGEPQNLHNHFLWFKLLPSAVRTDTISTLTGGLQCRVYQQSSMNLCVADGFVHQGCLWGSCLRYTNLQLLEMPSEKFNIPPICN